MEFKICLDIERFKECLDSDVLLAYGYKDATSNFVKELEIILAKSASADQFKENLEALCTNRKQFLKKAIKLLP